MKSFQEFKDAKGEINEDSILFDLFPFAKAAKRTWQTLTKVDKKAIQYYYSLIDSGKPRFAAVHSTATNFNFTDHDFSDLIDRLEGKV